MRRELEGVGVEVLEQGKEGSKADRRAQLHHGDSVMHVLHGLRLDAAHDSAKERAAPRLHHPRVRPHGVALHHKHNVRQRRGRALRGIPAAAVAIAAVLWRWGMRQAGLGQLHHPHLHGAGPREPGSVRSARAAGSVDGGSGLHLLEPRKGVSTGCNEVLQRLGSLGTATATLPCGTVYRLAPFWSGSVALPGLRVALLRSGCSVAGTGRCALATGLLCRRGEVTLAQLSALHSEDPCACGRIGQCLRDVVTERVGLRGEDATQQQRPRVALHPRHTHCVHSATGHGEACACGKGVHLGRLWRCRA